ncbi:uncharacterized protein LOC133730919 [Rosa rugosa]|uniref:uncharacterized protein LOC133730919 n=1 Tax=Rosa rugosa TaxID=74645 RepID=UPI002B409185|nr:uncharacterized protein LOC133730919 [Rosa rugosa]
MRLLSWNCQGLGADLTGKHLKRLIKRNSPSMLFLMETRQNESTILSWKKTLNFDHVYVVDPVGQSSGGLALFWDNSVQVSSITSTHNYISTSVLSVADSFLCNISWMYGNPHSNQKNAFWRSVYTAFSPRLIPWLCLGDFNEILWLHEKWGGLPQPRWRLNLFREFLSHTELSDLQFQGPDYTWFCTQHGRIVIKERLDRGLANNSWIAAKPCSQIFHLPKLGSDHRPILFDTSPPEVKAPHVFRFEHLWTSHPDSFQVVSSNWSTTPTTSASQTWEDNLNRCKSSLSTWASNTFPNFAKKVSTDTQLIQDILQSDQTDQVDQPCAQESIRQASDNILSLWSIEELYWKQRSRVSWLAHGDANTRFFHQTTLMNRRRNKILRLDDGNGSWLTKETEIVSHLTQYFKDIYTGSPPTLVDEVLHFVDPVVTSVMNDALLADISLTDVHQAVFELGALKAPGPDGFSGTFYQAYWEIVKDIVLNASGQILTTASVPESFNCTNIALIPKVDVPQLASHFRPIALCNFAYKILTKIISNRLKPFMPDLISENQSAFVTGRQIQDNILVAHEMFHHLKLLKGAQGGEFALKLDMNKAYDRVDWDFLRLVMLKMGFHPTWVQLVMSCVTTASLAIIVNGAPGKKFKPTRGLRQGDPLSPFLFLFINDVLSSMIRKICSNNLLDAIRIGVNGPLVSHLFFADDSIFFLKATPYNCEVLLDTLNSYCSASGQSVNHQKSSLFFSPNTSPDVVLHISSILGMGAVLDPGRYLGLPTIWGRSKVAALSYVKDSIEKKISGWHQSSLSHAGKETLIKSVALAVPAYPMTVFKFPVSLCNQINSSLANFWWGTSATKGIHWKSWTLLGLPKPDGGMGFRNIADFNLALLAKQAWRLHSNPDALWVRVLKNRYFPNSSFWEAARGSSPSWAWSSILEGRSLASAGSLWCIGSGTSVNLWKDNWIPNLPNFNLRTHPTPNDSNRLVASIIDRDTHTWNLTTLQSTLPVETIKAIQATSFGSSTDPDRLIWSANPTGTYTVHSGYNFLVKSSIPALSAHPHQSHIVSPLVWKWIWSVRAPPKVKHFLWRATSNALATNRNRHHRHLSLSPLCTFCNSHPETTEHILFLCPWALQAWFSHPLSYQVNQQSITTLDAWILGIFGKDGCFGPTDPSFPTHVAFLLWYIWKHRCDCIFNHSLPNPVVVSANAYSAAMEFLRIPPSLQPPKHSLHYHSTGTPHPWVPPPVGRVKINTDAAWDSSLNSGIAAIARDSSGILIGGSARSTLASSPMAAEAQAISLGLELAISLSLSSFQLESDSLVLISALLNPLSTVDWTASNNIAHIRVQGGLFHRVNWLWSSRSANAAADLVASLAKRRVCPDDWTSNPPPSLMRILLFDAVTDPP